jgi:hypothetical protein
MYVLHYTPDTASMILRLALEERGVEDRPELVDRAGIEAPIAAEGIERRPFTLSKPPDPPEESAI